MKPQTLLSLLLVSAFLSSCGTPTQLPLTFSTPVRTKTAVVPTATIPPTLAPTLIPTDTPIPIATVTATPPVLTIVNAAPEGNFDALGPQNAIWMDRVGALWDQYSGVGPVAMINASPGSSNPASSFYFTYSDANSTSLGLWQAGRGQEIYRFDDPTVYVKSLETSPDGQWLAVLTLDGVVLGSVTDEGSAGIPLFTPQDLPLDELTDSSGATAGLQAAFSPDSRLMAVANTEDKILLWDLQNNSQLGLVPGGHFGSTRCTSNYRGLAFTPGSQSLLIACQTYLVALDVSTLQSSLLLRLGGEPGWFALSPSGNFLAHAAARDTSLTLRQFPSGSVVARLSGFSVPALNLVFSPDETLLATSNGDDTFSLWDLQTAKRLTSLQAIYVWGFTTGSKFLLSADGSLWGVKTGLSEVPRQGVRVLHIQPEPIFNGYYLQSWEDALPAEWKAQEGAAPRYEVSLSRTYRQIEDCEYVGQAHLYRRQVGVMVKVTDLQNGSTVGSRTFWGGMPDPCGDSHSFPVFSTIDYQDGADPEIEPYTTWLGSLIQP